MTAAAATAGREKRVTNDFSPRVDLLDVFVLRADCRAYLWHAGAYELHEAVDVLQHDAERDGLIARIGQDAVQQIIASAFAPFWEADSEAS